jgi:hypothetical protein
MGTYKGFDARVEIDSVAPVEDNPVTYMESISFDLENGNEVVWQFGSRLPAEIKEGGIKLSGTLTRKYDGASGWDTKTDSKNLRECDGDGADSALTSYYLYIYPQGYGSASLEELQLSGVKFDKYSTSLSVDGFTTETVTWMATAYATGSTTGP